MNARGYAFLALQLLIVPITQAIIPDSLKTFLTVSGTMNIATLLQKQSKLDDSFLKNFAPQAQSILKINPAHITFTLVSIQEVTNGIQLRGRTKIGSVSALVEIRVIERDEQIYAALGIRPAPSQNTFKLSTLTNLLGPVLPSPIQTFVKNTLDSYITFNDPAVIISNIPGFLTEPIVGFTGIGPGLSAALFIPDNGCTICDAKTTSGLDRLGGVITIKPQTQSLKDIRFVPIVKPKTGAGICLSKALFSTISPILDAMNIDSIKNMLNLLNFCLFSTSGVVFDDDFNMTFFVSGVPKIGNKELGSQGMIKVWSDNGYKFAAGLSLTNDNINLFPLDAKFAQEIVDFIKANVTFNQPLLSITNAKTATIFDIDPVCNRIIDPDPAKQQEQENSLKQCRNDKRNALLHPFDPTSVPPPPDDDEEAGAVPPESAPTNPPAPAPQMPEERAQEEAKKQEDLKKLDVMFDFSALRQITEGIVFDVGFVAQNELKMLLERLNLDQAIMRLSVPLKKPLTRDDIKVSILQTNKTPIYIKDVVPGVEDLVNTLPSVSFFHDLQTLKFTPTTSELDVTATGQLFLIIRGIFNSSTFGDIDFELHHMSANAKKNLPQKSVVALRIKKLPNPLSIFGDKASDLAAFAQVFNITDALITISNYQTPEQATFFDQTVNVANGFALHTDISLLDNAPSAIKNILSNANLGQLHANIAITPDKTLRAEIFPADEKQICPAKLITSTLNIAGLGDMMSKIVNPNICMAPKLYFTRTFDGQSSLIIVPADAQHIDTFEIKINAATSAFTFGVRGTGSINVSSFVPALGDALILQAPMLLYTSASQDTVFDWDPTTNTSNPTRSQATRVNKGLSLETGIDKNSRIFDQLPVLKKIALQSLPQWRVRITLGDQKTVSFIRTNKEPITLCASDLVPDNLPVPTVCIQLQELQYTGPKQLTATGTATVFNTSGDLLVRINGANNLLAVDTKQLNMRNAKPFDVIADIAHLKNTRVVIANNQTKEKLFNDTLETTIEPGVNITGDIEFGSPFKEVLTLVGLTTLRATVSISPEGTVTVSAGKEVDEKIAGALALKNATIKLVAQQPITLSFALDGTLAIGSSSVPMTIKASMNTGTSSVTFTGQTACVGTYCPKIDKPFSIPISIQALSASNKFPNGLPLSLSFSVVGGVLSGFGVSGAFQIDDSHVIVNTFLDVATPQKFGILFEADKLCLTSMLSAVGAALPDPMSNILQTPFIKDLACVNNAKVQIAAQTTTINAMKFNKGIDLSGNGKVPLLGVNSDVLLRVVPLSFGSIITSPDEIGVTIDGHMDPIIAHVANITFLKLSASEKETDKKGPHLHAALTPKDQSLVVSGNLSLLNGAITNDIDLNFDLQKQIFTGSVARKIGDAHATINVLFDPQDILKSFINITADNLSFANFVSITSQTTGVNINVPSLPLLTPTLNNLNIILSPQQSSFTAKADFAGQTIAITGSLTKDGVLLTGILAPLNLADIITITDATSKNQGPHMSLALTKNPGITLDGAINLAKIISGNGTLIFGPGRLDGTVTGSLADVTISTNISGNMGTQLDPQTLALSIAIKDDLSAQIAQALKVAIKPIQDTAQAVYGSSVGVVKEIDGICHQIPVIASIACWPIDRANGMIKDITDKLNKLKNIFDPTNFGIESIILSGKLSDLTSGTLPSATVKLSIAGSSQSITINNIRLGNITSQVTDAIKTQILNPEKLLDDIINIGDKLKNLITDAKDLLAQALKTMLNNIVGAVGELGKQAFNAAQDAAKEVGKLGEQTTQEAAKAANEAARAAAQAASQAAQAANEAARAAASTAQAAAQAASQAAQAAAQAVAAAAQAAAQAVAHAAKAAADALAKAARSLCFFC